MPFNSIPFLFFFVLVTTAYFLIPHRYRWFWLLAASCYFYMAFIPVYIFILAFIIAIDYFTGIWIAQAEGHDNKRRLFLLLGIVTNLGVLFFFKYFNFFNSNLAVMASFWGRSYPIPNLSIVLPIGLSFLALQSLSYMIEIYNHRETPETNFGILALYVMFFPKLVAGPIERPQNLLHQFRDEHDFEYQRVTDGLKMMAWGFFKKIIIADHLAPLVNNIYAQPGNFQAISLLMATLFFSIQIYCDFSGYSDIAIGSAQVMGFKLMKNFDHPYFSRTISEFWQRWHISLSTFLRDYIFFPLRRTLLKKRTLPSWTAQMIPPLVTMLVSGLWHGDNWTFIIWGAIHGFYILLYSSVSPFLGRLVSRLKLNKFPRLMAIIQWAVTFSLITFAWIFFRAKSMADAVYIVIHIFTDIPHYLGSALIHLAKHSQQKDFWDAITLYQAPSQVIVLVASLLILFIVEVLQYNGDFLISISRQPRVIRWSLYVILLTWILVFMTSDTTGQPFIYFQF